MSRKRILKKLHKLQEVAVARLGDLYLQGADAEFLALAAEHFEAPAASPLAAEWAEVAERAVRGSLSQGDLGRLEDLLRSLRRSGRLRPLLRSLITASEAVLDLSAGRLEAARTRLAALAGTGEAARVLPPDLLSSLQALAQDEPVGGGWRLDEPYLQASRDFAQALRRCAAGASAPAADCRDLARSLAEMRSAAPAETPADAELRRLFDEAGRCLSLLNDLAGLEARLALLPQGERPQMSVVIAGWLRGPGPLLAATLGSSEPALLAPLRRTVGLRWRALLERVAAREGPPGLMALWTANPKLLAHDMHLPRGVAGLREAAQARQLLAARRYEDLARLLRSRSQTAVDRGELAALWSLELWASSQEPDKEEEDEEWTTEPPLRGMTVRLQQMSGEIGRRFSPEDRAEVARVLRNVLFGLCRETFFNEHLARAALALLEHQPDDIGLLVAGVAGAVAAEDSQTLRTLEARLALGVEAQAKDLPIVRLLMVEVAREDPWDLAPILERLRRLFAGPAWTEIAQLVAREMGGTFARTLREESLDGEDVSLTRSALVRLRPLLAGTPGFAAAEVVLDCWHATPRTVDKRLDRFLAAFPGLDAPFAAFQMMDRALLPWGQRGAHSAFQRLVSAVIDRLDGRWQLWSSVLPSLAMTAEESDRRCLDEKIRRLLSSPELTAEGREILGQALRVIEELDAMRRVPVRPQRAPRAPRKPRARRAATPRQLDS
jgi:hypothetical protein